MGCVLVLESLVRSSFIIGWLVYSPWCCFGDRWAPALRQDPL